MGGLAKRPPRLIADAQVLGGWMMHRHGTLPLQDADCFLCLSDRVKPFACSNDFKLGQQTEKGHDHAVLCIAKMAAGPRPTPLRQTLPTDANTAPPNATTRTPLALGIAGFLDRHAARNPSCGTRTKS